MTVLLWLGPAVLGALLLWLGRYPGEGTILARRASRTRPRRTGVATTMRRYRAVLTLPRGGCLLAASLSGRAPPTSGR